MVQDVVELERVCAARGAKINLLEEKLRDFHKMESMLSDLQSCFDSCHSELVALRESYVSLCGENQSLRRELYHLRNRGFWHRLFNVD